MESSRGGPPEIRKDCIPYATPISSFRVMLVALNRPPGIGSTKSAVAPGAAGLIVATSNLGGGSVCPIAVPVRTRNAVAGNLRIPAHRLTQLYFVPTALREI